ncbi:hypothetical protein BO85DRAFT_10003 [Aspergillus piperis CBS 112811]|uniref:Uncharacterized protein n=1 Tax=Aspergillus piperis CBS 112811 TaxID=1448313 RepID=A0A8G1VRA9_9EURO|nr:hypothetical protein BO85DRAFT_10003 [Aspergillus piperis CBS 112811]RAH62869.1 hypothetical protein BO85DRAFT_10003 [Aspergillus piperis CBS 112811]
MDEPRIAPHSHHHKTSISTLPQPYILRLAHLPPSRKSLGCPWAGTDWLGNHGGSLNRVSQCHADHAATPGVGAGIHRPFTGNLYALNPMMAVELAVGTTSLERAVQVPLPSPSRARHGVRVFVPSRGHPALLPPDRKVTPILFQLDTFSAGFEMS